MNEEESTFIDSNIIIYVLMKDPEYGERALRHLCRVESGEIRGVISTLILSQIYAYLKRRGKVEVIEKFSSYVEESPIYN